MAEMERGPPKNKTKIYRMHKETIRSRASAVGVLFPDPPAYALTRAYIKYGLVLQQREEGNGNSSSALELYSASCEWAASTVGGVQRTVEAMAVRRLPELQTRYNLRQEHNGKVVRANIGGENPHHVQRSCGRSTLTPK